MKLTQSMFRKYENIAVLDSVASYNTYLDSIQKANPLLDTENIIKRLIRKKLLKYQVGTKNYVSLTDKGKEEVYSYRRNARGMYGFEGKMTISSEKRIRYSRIRAIEKDLRKIVERKYHLSLGISFDPDVFLPRKD